jgi:hypothetical protein
MDLEMDFLNEAFLVAFGQRVIVSKKLMLKLRVLTNHVWATAISKRR